VAKPEHYRSGPLSRNASISDILNAIWFKYLFMPMQTFFVVVGSFVVCSLALRAIYADEVEQLFDSDAAQPNTSNGTWRANCRLIVFRWRFIACYRFGFDP
jgi:hypothetical protein